ncbi:uncharacterized protein LOC129254742 [Lytechinus pictus]|uniref:uncharacterized protein LOC129254742 n=1 Tax=Lytechinus pictus TaxID=7653 RepID=UPI0030B9D3B0
MTSNFARYITLPTISVQNGILRFINLNENLHSVLIDGDLSVGTPLFLATDVLTGTSVTADNQPRIHARYGKQGLATKLTFPSGIKFPGLHGTSRGLWFYSVIGALKVTFEFHSPHQQVAIMDALQDVWRKRYKDPPLPSSIEVQYVNNNSSKSKGVDGDISLQSTGPGLPIDHGETTQLDPLDGKGIPDRSQEVSRNAIKRNYTISISNTVSKRKRTLEEFVNAPVLKINKSTSMEDRVLQGGNDFTDIQVHHVEEVLTENESPRSSSDQAKCLCGSIKQRLRELGERFNDEILTEELTCSMEHVVEMLHAMTRVEIDACLQLLNSLSDAVCETTERDSEAALGQKSDRVSQVLAEWLGLKFNQEVSQISERVVEFKQKNIDQINNLPQAKQLVNSLFPKPMVNFIMAWLGKRTEQRNSCSEMGNAASDVLHENDFPISSDDDCVGTTGFLKKKPTEEDISCYPLAQFILELANQTLISGMAHVIYPRLIQSTNS